MKTKLFAALLLIFLPLLAFVPAAQAQTFRTNQETATVASSETIDGTIWIAASTIDVAGTVDGDLFCAGQSVVISGNVNGDVICAAQTLTISGTVTGDVRLAGQTINLSADVAQNASLMGQTITVGEQASIGRDLSVASQAAKIDGTIGRDLAVASETATISGAVERDMTAAVEAMSINASATVKGKVEYTSPSPATISSQATIGEVQFTKADPRENTATYNDFGISLGGALFFVFTVVMSALAFAVLLPGLLRRSTDKSIASATRALLALFVGLVAGVVMPFIIILLAITVVGIPLAIVLTLVWVLIALLSGAFSAFYIGRLVLQHQTNNLLVMMVVGSLFVGLLLLLPFINIFVFMLCVWFGVGTVLLHLKDSFESPRYDVQQTPTKVHTKKN